MHQTNSRKEGDLIIYECQECEYVATYSHETCEMKVSEKGNIQVKHRLYKAIDPDKPWELSTDVNIGTLVVVSRCDLDKQGMGRCEYQCDACKPA